MKFELSRFKRYKEYFQSLAEKHVEISSFLVGDQDVLQVDSGEQDVLLMVDYYEPVGIRDNNADNYVALYRGNIGILTVPDSETFEDMEAAFELTEQIAVDILARLREDYQAFQNRVDFSQTTFGRMEPTTIRSTEYLGTRIELVFRDSLNLKLDPIKWNDKPNES
jgi:hypothetical protein